MSVTGRSLAIATDSGALATSAIGVKSLTIAVGHLLHRHRRGDEGRGVEQQRVSVGRRLGDGVAADDAVAARPVLDDERLPHLLGKLLRERAAQSVERAAGRERNDHAHWPVGISLGKRARHGERREHCEDQTQGASRFMAVLLAIGMRI